MRCKGTTKNAHTQEKRENISQNNRFIYLIPYSSFIQACLRMMWWIGMTRCNRFSEIFFERPGVWSAFCESSYGGIGFKSVAIVWVIKPRQMSEGSAFLWYRQIFLSKIVFLPTVSPSFVYPWYTFGIGKANCWFRDHHRRSLGDLWAFCGLNLSTYSNTGLGWKSEFPSSFFFIRLYNNAAKSGGNGG